MDSRVDWGGVPRPDVDDPELAPYWAGAAREELLIPACLDCGTHLWPPRAACPHCGGLDRQWHAVRGTGTLFTWTVIGHTPIPGFKAALPFAVAVVAIDGAPNIRMVGRVLSPPDALRVGAAVRVRYEEISDELRIPIWELDDDAAI